VLVVKPPPKVAALAMLIALAVKVIAPLVPPVPVSRVMSPLVPLDVAPVESAMVPDTPPVAPNVLIVMLPLFPDPVAVDLEPEMVIALPNEVLIALA
jgi:hypothetical protein